MKMFGETAHFGVVKPKSRFLNMKYTHTTGDKASTRANRSILKPKMNSFNAMNEASLLFVQMMFDDITVAVAIY